MTVQICPECFHAYDDWDLHVDHALHKLNVEHNAARARDFVQIEITRAAEILERAGIEVLRTSERVTQGDRKMLAGTQEWGPRWAIKLMWAFAGWPDRWCVSLLRVFNDNPRKRAAALAVLETTRSEPGVLDLIEDIAGVQL